MSDYGPFQFLLLAAGGVLFLFVTLAPLKLFGIHRELQRQSEILERIAQRLDGDPEQ